MSDTMLTTVRDGRGGEMSSPAFITQEHLDRMAAEFTAEPGDVFVVTYPKCGTTWMEQVVHLLLHDGQQGQKVLTDEMPWIEALPGRTADFQTFLAGMERPRVFTSHLTYQLTPGLDESGARFVTVARNPKDAAVSGYFHFRRMGYEGSWDDFLQMFMQDQIAGGFYDYVLDWWAASKTADNIFFTTYEAMQADLGAVARDLGQFLGVNADAALIDKVVAQSSFKAMATNPQTDFSWMPGKEGEESHFRKGVVGDWRNHFTAAQNEAFDAQFAARMAGSDLRFDFGEG